MADAVKRLNYFDHQFLRAPDFNDEQNYHLTMRRKHNQMLHTPGIVQGLVPTAQAGATVVNVSSGFAIDGNGREIVLSGDVQLDLTSEAVGKSVYLTIEYNEQQSDPSTDTGATGNTRWTELPKVSFSEQPPAVDSTVLVLGQVSRTATGLSAIDLSARKDAGVVVSGDLKVNTLALRRNGVDPAAWPTLSCSGANQATLSVANLGIGTASPGRILEVSAADSNTGLKITGTDSQRSWLMAVGVAAGDGKLTFYDYGAAAQRLTIDKSGNVGIGTSAPASNLHVDVASSGTPIGAMSLDVESFATVPNAQASYFFRVRDIGAAPPNGFTHFMIRGDGNVGIGTAPARAKLQVSGMVGNTVGLFGDQGISLVAGWPNVGFNTYFNGGWKSISPGFAGVINLDQNDGSMGFFLAPAKLAAADAAFAPTRWMAVSAAGNVGLAGLLTVGPMNSPTDNRIIFSLSKTGGGQLQLANNANDNCVYLEAFSANGQGSAATLFLTGSNGGDVPLILLRATQTEVSGAALKPGGGSWGALSDLRLKQNVSPLGGALDRLLALRGVQFEWKEPEKFGNLTGTQIGLVAQEVEKVFPEWVGKDSSGFKTVNVCGFEALVIESLRQLQSEISALKDQVAGSPAKAQATEVPEESSEKMADASAKTSKKVVRKSEDGPRKG